MNNKDTDEYRAGKKRQEQKLEKLLLSRLHSSDKDLSIEKVRREVMKGVNEIRNDKGTVYNSAEELAEDVISRGKARTAEKPNS